MIEKALRSWRVLLLAWAVLLAPQMAVLHALSHSLPGNAQESGGESDKRNHSAGKVCESCLAFAHLAAALPSGFEWRALAQAHPAHAGITPSGAEARPRPSYQARAPPLTL